MGVTQLDADEAEEDTKRVTALVVPFVRALRQELLSLASQSTSRQRGNTNENRKGETGMFLIQQVDLSEVVLVKDVDPLLSLRDELERFGSRPY